MRYYLEGQDAPPEGIYKKIRYSWRSMQNNSVPTEFDTIVSNLCNKNARRLNI